MKRSSEKHPWANSRILLTCGTGGVGKTTLSAAIAVSYASQGFKTIVLTIDPAKRLAQALGLSSLSHKPQRIKLKARGSLDAMMLNTKRMFDSIIEKYSPDENSKKTVLNHPLYKHLSTMLAGSQEYMAMENLYNIATEYDYEKIIVDTPPSKHALDFLDAPEKMVNAITNSILKLLIKPYQWAGKKGGKVFSIFGKMTGVEFLQEISDFLASTVSLLDGFKERATSVIKLLGSKDVSLILITSPTTDMVCDASNFINALRDRNLSLSSCLINMTTPKIADSLAELQTTAKWCRKNNKTKDVGDYISTFEKRLQLEKSLISDLRKQNPNIPIFTLEETTRQIHSPEGLTSLYKKLISHTVKKTPSSS
jgi:anion-transporting  ArsA/GET3 family ATPase